MGNRIWAVIRGEAQKIIDEGIANEDDIDTIMKTGWNWPAGPFEMVRGARKGWA